MLGHMVADLDIPWLISRLFARSQEASDNDNEHTQCPKQLQTPQDNVAGMCMSDYQSNFQSKLFRS